jgi:hypothetical protein
MYSRLVTVKIAITSLALSFFSPDNHLEFLLPAPQLTLLGSHGFLLHLPTFNPGLFVCFVRLFFLSPRRRY